MLYLLLAIVSSAMISILMRLSERHISNNLTMLAANYLACTTLSALYAGSGLQITGADGLGDILLLGLISGALFLASFVIYNRNVSVNGVVMSATFMKLGVLVPTAMSVFLFRETPGAGQILGYVLALAAIALIHFDNGAAKVQKKWLLLSLLLCGGLTDGMAKIFEQMGYPALKDLYLLSNFLVAFVLCVLLVVLKKQRFALPELGFGLLLGIPNYFSSRFLLLSLQDIAAMVAYPTYSVGTIVFVTVVGMALFRERISRRKWLALALIAAALVLLNI